MALVATLGTGAYATIPGADGQIKGCYATKDGLLRGIPYSKGDLRAVDAGERCRSYEKAVSWSEQGPPGPAGEQGPQGEPGAPGISGYEIVQAEHKGFADVSCPAGKKPLGGGFHATPGVSPYASNVSVDAEGNYGWSVGTSDFNNTVTVYAICANVAP